MAYRRNKIFTAGIVWDPREPYPGSEDYGRNTRGAVPHVDNVVDFSGGGKFLPDPHAAGRTIQAATTWPVAAPALPRFTVQEPGRNVLPPLSVKVDASIVQDTARVTVTQLFWNDSTNPIKEAAFTFPLPTGCTVTDFSCRIGTNKIIKGTVKPREEAREAFKHHIRNYDTAAGLLEQDTTEIFTTVLGNVPEKTKVRVTITYITILKHRFVDGENSTSFTLPTYIAPRYGDAPEEYNDAASTDVRQGLTLDIEIVESEKITSIASPSHAIAVERQRGAREAESFADLAGDDGRSHVETAAIRLGSGRLFLDKDFVLDIVTAPEGNIEGPQAWLEEHPTVPRHKALMLTIPRKFLTSSAPPMQRSEILFLADRSGSMSDKIEPLKSAMRFFLKGIPEERKFNIWCFGSHYISWQPRSVQYSARTLSAALSWVDRNFDADMGGTELLPAIEAIVAARDRQMMTDVIVLTDGETWRLDQTLDYIQKTRNLTEGRVRFFALGIGRAVSHALVDGIAKAGGGYAEVVQDASHGGWEARVVSMAQAALMSSHLGPVRLEFDIQEKEGHTKVSTLADAKRSPADISAINPFDHNRVYFLFDTLREYASIKTIRIEHKGSHEAKSLIVPVNILEKKDTTLHRLAARSMLDDLERGRSHIHLGANRPYPGSWEETNMVRKEAEEIACKWSLVSKWTSFFLAEEPCSPVDDDAPLDGVIQVEESPGDDLLQPRGLVAQIPTIEAASSQSSGARHGKDSGVGEQYQGQLGNDANPSTYDSGGGYDDGYGESYAPYSGSLLPFDDDVDAPRIKRAASPDYCDSGEAHESRIYRRWGSLKPAFELGLSNSDLMVGRRRRRERSPVRPSEDRDVGSTPADLQRLSMDTLCRTSGSLAYLRPSQPLNSTFDDDDDTKSDRKGVEGMLSSEFLAPPTGPDSGLHEVAPISALKGRPQEAMSSYKRRQPTAGIVTPQTRDDDEDDYARAPRSSPQYKYVEVLGAPSKIVKEHIDPLAAEGRYNQSRQPKPCMGSPQPCGDDGNYVRAPRTTRDREAAMTNMSTRASATAKEPPAENQFIASLLQFQQFDGAVDFGDWTAAEKWLGKQVADALQRLHQAYRGLSPQVLWTAAVKILLERDLAPFRELWGLMAAKMQSYVSKNSPAFVSGEMTLLEVVRKGLEGSKLSIHQERGNETEEEEEDTGDDTLVVAAADAVIIAPGPDHKDKEEELPEPEQDGSRVPESIVRCTEAQTQKEVENGQE